ncbi:hypothetical protein [Chitinophaga filiformis]|uniref:Uncharacterized protein n=1 Tax=Chitinophaga filiformis TaxID=104663 RepID=A0ABY4HWZ5_CHIFI|nr:hypothetical protein [Chitinophaga filiformis]UPK67689.1 hypothetical protein MYF79_22330 [Chitinophaga filiformis]
MLPITSGALVRIFRKCFHPAAGADWFAYIALTSGAGSYSYAFPVGSLLVSATAEAIADQYLQQDLT